MSYTLGGSITLGMHHLIEKKSLLKMWQKKKFVVKIDEKYVDHKNHQMLTYIIGKAYDKKNIFNFFDETLKKKLSDVDRKKKDCFLTEVKKFASNKNSSPPPPPQISNGASLITKNFRIANDKKYFTQSFWLPRGCVIKLPSNRILKSMSTEHWVTPR